MNVISKIENRLLNIGVLLKYERVIQDKVSALEDSINLNKDKMNIIKCPVFEVLFGVKNIEGLNNIKYSIDTTHTQFVNDLNVFISYRPSDRGLAGYTNKEAYRELLTELGYKELFNNISFLGDTNQYKELIELIVKNYLDLNYGYIKDASSNIMYKNRKILEANGKSAKLNFLSAEIQKLDEDFRFRVFYKQTKKGDRVISCDLIVKLPRGAVIKNDLTSRDFLTIATKYDMKLIGDCKTTTLGTRLGLRDIRLENRDAYESEISYMYNCLSFSLIDDLGSFCDDNLNKHSFLDYIKFCRGEDTESFSEYAPNLMGLGSKITFGTTINSLKQIALTSKGGIDSFNAGLLIAGAGSGKTIVLNSILLQAIALNNEPYLVNGNEYSNSGNGAVVLMTYKAQEWIPAWQQLFREKGKKLYGFDGSFIERNLLRYNKTTKSKDNKKVPSIIEDAIPMYVAGLYFLANLSNIIRDIYGKAGCESAVDFNNKDCSIDGIDKLPRVMVLIDEVNSLASNSDFRVPMQSHLFTARETRTANMTWLLAGQDISASVLSNSERSNYNYNILGTLSGMESPNKNTNRYMYYGANVPQEIIEYKKLHNKNILTRGVFLVDNELTKSLYLDESQNNEALNEILDISGGVGLDELEQVINYGIQNGLFTKRALKIDVYDDKYPDNNILAAGLYQMGLISEEQYKLLTEERLGEISALEDLEISTPNQRTDKVYNYNQGEKQQNSKDFCASKNINLGQSYNDKQDNFQDFKKSHFKYNRAIPQTAGEMLYLNDYINREDIEDIRSKVNVYSVKVDRYVDTKIFEDTNLGKTSFISKLINNSPIYADMKLKQNFSAVLDQVNETIKLSNVRLIEILGNNLFLNKRLIDLSELVGCDMYGISNKIDFNELLNFRVLSRKCKGVKKYTLDTQVLNLLQSELGDDWVVELFNLNKLLKNITILNRDGSSTELERSIVLYRVKNKNIGSEGVSRKVNFSNHIKGSEYCKCAFKKGKKSKSKIISGLWYTTGACIGTLGLVTTLLSGVVDKGLKTLTQ